MSKIDNDIYETVKGILEIVNNQYMEDGQFMSRLGVDRLMRKDQQLEELEFRLVDLVSNLEIQADINSKTDKFVDWYCKNLENNRENYVGKLQYYVKQLEKALYK